MTTPRVLNAPRSRRTGVSQYAIVEAPSVLGLRPTGVERLPDALIGAGLDAQLRARRGGRVEPPPYDDRRDPETLMLNPQGIADYTPKLADAIGEVLDTGDFPGAAELTPYPLLSRSHTSLSTFDNLFDDIR
jgi:hypothetical protein